MFKSGSQREGLEQVLKGIDPSKTQIVEKAAHSAETAVERGADATAAYGKTRQSVQTDAGNTFEVQGKKATTKLDNTGSATTTTRAGELEGNRSTTTLSKSNKRRADVANREVPAPENNTRVGNRKRGSVPRKYKKNQNVPKGIVSNNVVVDSVGNNKFVGSTITNGNVVNAHSANLNRINPETIHAIGETEISNGITNTTRKTGRKSVLERAGKWVRKNPRKAALIGGGLIATGAAAGIAAGNSKNKRGSARA